MIVNKKVTCCVFQSLLKSTPYQKKSLFVPVALIPVFISFYGILTGYDTIFEIRDTINEKS